MPGTVVPNGWIGFLRRNELSLLPFFPGGKELFSTTLHAHSAVTHDGDSEDEPCYRPFSRGRRLHS